MLTVWHDDDDHINNAVIIIKLHSFMVLPRVLQTGVNALLFAFSALTLLVWRQEEHLAHKNSTSKPIKMAVNIK